MTADEFLERWVAERPMYEAWGKFVAERITEEIRPLVAPLSTDLFIRIPVKTRLKSDGSFLTKAFYRPEKKYLDPFQQITDKVGVRFVVLLDSAVKIICNAIERCSKWISSKDKDYEEEQAKEPYLFKYQSVHYVVRCSGTLSVMNETIFVDSPCEVQVRTLLQHAHSELTHDTIYKPSVIQTPDMQRAAAKSMALLEATGDYFEQLVDKISNAVGPSRKLTEDLTGVYRESIGQEPDPTRVEGLLNEAYAPLVGEAAVDAVKELLARKTFVKARIKDRARTKLLFRQPSILMVYAMVSKRPMDAWTAWPLTSAELRPIYTDLGEAAPAD